jgi:hypothetical protein
LKWDPSVTSTPHGRVSPHSLIFTSVITVFTIKEGDFSLPGLEIPMYDWIRLVLVQIIHPPVETTPLVITIHYPRV